MGNFITKISRPATNLIGISGGSSSGGAVLVPENTASVHLSIINGVMSADLQLSPDSGNRAVLHSNGLYVNTGSGLSPIFLKNSDFTTATQYINTALAGVQFLLWGSGTSFLKYNFANPSDSINEYQIYPSGGFNILINGFDVNNGNNYFFLIPK